MTCEEYQSDISALLDRELSDERMTAVFAHLAQCRSCREYHTAALVVRESLAADEAPVLPAEIERDIRSIPQFRPVREGKRLLTRALWKRTIYVPAPVAALAAVMIMLGAIILFNRPVAESPHMNPRMEPTVYYLSSPDMVVRPEQPHNQ